VSQHFFAVTINKADIVAVLNSLANSSVVTDVNQPSLVQNGGPADVQELVSSLGKGSTSSDALVSTLSSGIKLFSKPSSLHVPVWQMVSAKLGGVNLLVASWWADPAIYSTAAGQILCCWSPALGKPGAVEIAINGQWDGTDLGFLGGPEPDRNHAKVAVSVPKPEKVTKKLTGPKLCIFGDMNQQGAYNPEPPSGCNISQNARGGLFYGVENPSLWSSITKLLKGWTAPPVASSTSGNVPPTKKKSPAAPKTAAAKKTAKKAPKR
jgi:hypothetical protein